MSYLASAPFAKGTAWAVSVGGATYLFAFNDAGELLLLAGGMVCSIAPCWLSVAVAQYAADHAGDPIESEGASEAAIVAGLGTIAGRYGEGKCVEAANAMANFLEKENKEYGFARLTMEPKTFIASIKHPEKLVTDNGLHWGLIHNGNIYCNIHPTGLPKEEWRADFVGRYPILYEEFTTIQ